MSKSLSPDRGSKSDCDQEVKAQRESFSSSERQIYEMQLAQLQEQLVNTMIDYQDMSSQLKKLQAVDVDKLKKELEDEKARNNELKEKLKQKQKSSSSKLQRKNASRMDPRHGSHGMAADSSAERGGDDWVDLGKEEELHTLPAASSHDTNGLSAEPGGHSQEHEEHSYDVLDGAHTGQLEQQTAAGTGEEEVHRVQRVKTKLEMWKVQAVDLLADRLWDFVNDEPEAVDEEDGEGEPLAVKTLKENINRFTAASFLIFLVYMYSVWHGYLFSLILFTMIWKLFMNYLHAKGIAKQLGFTEKPKKRYVQVSHLIYLQEWYGCHTSTSDEHSWSDKFQLVLQVARKVQNILGKMADSLEKVKNLLTWQGHPEATRKLFTALCFALLTTLTLKGPTLFMLIGLFLGIKLFIVNPIYHRFPKVKRRYDGTAKLWKELPTDAEQSARQSFAELTNQEMLERTSSVSSLSSPNTSSSEQPSSTLHTTWPRNLNYHQVKPFCQAGKMAKMRFDDKEKPSPTYLCFEKTRSLSGKNLIIKLDTITSISKAKPIGTMPGTGMALEIYVKGVEKPYIFGAIIGRDDVFESIKATGRAGNIPWALM
ncbi:GRAM domain-containing protein 4 [Desmophyllum pertusum]|uniref:GRAM domain-containing protein 4 n=1 Tax=Desmophyllum pertusum TaxID=174260 RepID=A0A9W9Z9T2_9CNID|nr:GRAM domain-containing protein 4 [Desmophyllum pertusum]